MADNPLLGLSIRTSLVRRRNMGFIYACDLDKEEEDIPHVEIFRWENGGFTTGSGNYNVHTVCAVTQPMRGIIMASEPGYYSLNSAEGVIGGDIIADSAPPSEKPRFRGIRSVSTIEGRAHAVGYQGMVYRLEEPRLWRRLDEGLSDSFSIEAIDGFSENELYSVGLHGEGWWSHNGIWSRLELPTTSNLTTVKCAGDGNVYIAGAHGVLLRGRQECWEVIFQDLTGDTFWDLEWFNNDLYLSVTNTLYRLGENGLQEVKFGPDRPNTCYQLSTADGVMWSSGASDVVSFDGVIWSRIASTSPV